MVPVAFKEGHPDKLRFLLENSPFDRLHSYKQRDAERKDRAAEAVRAAMQQPAGSPIQRADARDESPAPEDKADIDKGTGFV
jgi:hypothetical protein